MARHGRASTCVLAFGQSNAERERRRRVETGIERTQGLVFSEALALRTSRKLAERLCQQAVRDKRHLRDLVASDAEAARTLSAADIAALFEPTASYGAAPAMIREVLSDWAKARESAL